MTTSVRLTTAALVTAGAVATAGCHSAAPGRHDAVLVAAMRQIAAASTSSRFCSLVSRGFATYLGGGNAAACASRLPRILTMLPHGDLTIRGVKQYRDEYIVNAVVRPTFPQSTDYFFVSQSGTWRLHSIGIYKAPDAGPGTSAAP